MLALLLFIPLRAGAAQSSFDVSFIDGGAKESAKAQKSLSKWLKANFKKDFEPKMKALVLRRQVMLAEQGVDDLRDAVASIPAGKTLGRPGLPQMDCPTLEECASPSISTHADSMADVTGAVSSLVRPWLLLEQRRSGSTGAALAAANSDALMTLTLDGLVKTPVEVLVSPDPLGGFQVWLSSESDLEQVYSFFREALIHPSRLPDYGLIAPDR